MAPYQTPQRSLQIPIPAIPIHPLWTTRRILHPSSRNERDGSIQEPYGAHDAVQWGHDVCYDEITGTSPHLSLGEILTW